MEKTYLIYKHTSPSGRSYIGLTSNYEERCRRHRHPKSKCTLFRKAIQKYGWDAFSHEILETGLTLESANKLEQEMITKHKTLSPAGYNLTTGGSVCKITLERVEALRKRMLGNTYARGRIRPEAERAKVSKALTGRKKTREAVEKVRKANLGKKRPLEARVRQSLSMVGRKARPEAIEKTRQANLGRKHSIETRSKMVEAAKNRPPVLMWTRMKLSEIYRNLPESEKERRRELSRIANTGKKMSAVSIEKTRQANLGKTYSESTKKKMSESAKNRNVSLEAKRIADLRMRIKQSTSILLDSKVRGIYKIGSKFCAKTQFMGKTKHLGTFESEEAANSAYRSAITMNLVEYERMLEEALQNFCNENNEDKE